MKRSMILLILVSVLGACGQPAQTSPDPLSPVSAPSNTATAQPAAPLVVTTVPTPRTPSISPTLPLAPANGTLTGTVHYPAQPMLPAGSTLTVQLLDLTDTGVFGPAIVSEQRLPLAGQRPTPFSIAYDPARINPHWSYAVDAWISAPGRLDWRAVQVTPVLTHGHPATVEVTVEPPLAVAAITGTITYSAQPALPADAVLEIAVVQSTADVVLGAARLAPVTPGPTSFILEYDPTHIDPQTMYVVYAILHRGQQAPLVTTTPSPVITHGHPTTVDVELHAATTSAAFSGMISACTNRLLPRDATLVIEVEGSEGDDMAYSRGQQTIALDGARVIPFAIAYDAPTSDPHYTYPHHVHPKAYTYSVTASLYAGKVDLQSATVRPAVLCRATHGVLLYVPIDMQLESVPSSQHLSGA